MPTHKSLFLNNNQGFSIKLKQAEKRLLQHMRQFESKIASLKITVDSLCVINIYQ